MKTALWIVITAVLVGALAFFGGVKYGQSTAASTQGVGAAARFAGRGGAGGAGRGGFAGGSIATGTVIAQSANSITVKLAGGGSKIVYLSADTRISKVTTLTAADLKVGENVVAVGTASGNDITARSVQLGTFEGGGFRGPGQ